MGEPLWTNFDARVPKTWEPQPLSDLLDVALINGYVDTDESGDDIEINGNGEANYGLWDDDLDTVFEWCHARQVPYIAHDESKYDCEGTIRVFDGFIVREGRFDQSIVLSKPYYDSIVEGRHDDYDSVDDYFAKLDVSIAELSIDHLPVWPPPDPDDALSFDEVEAAGLDPTLRGV